MKKKLFCSYSSFMSMKCFVASHIRTIPITGAHDALLSCDLLPSGF